MNDIIAPHGGQLIDRELHGEAAEEALIRAAAYPSVRLAGHTVSDLICIGTGVYSPLRGFMTRRDYWRVLDEMRLESGHVWSMPITLPVDPGVADGLREGQFVRLEDETGRIVGMMRVEDRFARDAIHEAKHVFRTQDEAHPGVARLYGESPVLIGGEIWLVTDREVTDTEITDPEAIDTAVIDTVAIDTVAIDTAAIDTAAISTGVVRREATGTGTTDPESSGPASIGAEIADSVDVLRRFVLRPAETRAEFRRRGWRRVVGFQTRNPVHRAHEYIQKCALETVDGLLLHPLIGETKADDVPARVRMSSYRALIEAYYPADRVLLAAFPAAMRYAGPREAVFHALCRKNYGCSHFIVGRDHAGVGNYYGTYDAQRIFDEFSPEELGIQPLFFEHAFYCHKCAGMATAGTCPHGSDDRVTLSGTKVREMLRAGEAPPPEFTRPEVAAVLMEALRETVQVGG